MELRISRKLRAAALSAADHISEPLTRSTSFILHLHTVEGSLQEHNLVFLVDTVREYYDTGIQPSLTPASLNFLLWVPAALSIPVA